MSTMHGINLHGLGFIQIPLEAGQRLHVWHPELPRRRCFEASNCHNHRWHMHSRILVGQLEDTMYAIERDCDVQHATHFEYSHEGDRRPSGCRPWTRTANVHLHPLNRRRRAAREEYTLSAYIIHSTRVLSPDGKLATLIMKGPAQTAAASSFCRKDVAPEEDFDRYQLSETDLWNIVADVLGRWQ